MRKQESVNSISRGKEGNANLLLLKVQSIAIVIVPICKVGLSVHMKRELMLIFRNLKNIYKIVLKCESKKNK